MTQQRIQLALNVDDIEKAITYYSKLFGAEVNKRKPGYANFAINEPPLKLVLFENPGATERLNHMGVEGFDQKHVAEATARFVDADIADKQEIAATCCYATQDKIWSTDPQGMRWEWYTILEDAETFFGEEEASAKPDDAPAPVGCC